LEKFTSSDLRTWKRQSENLEKYHVQLYYHLQGLRALHHDELCEALCSSASFALALKKWVRIVDYKYSLQPLAAAGSLVHGGRFNIGNDLDPSKFPAFPALYLAENHDTAYEERFGSRPSSATEIEGHDFALRRPASFASVSVSGHVSNLFDLRSAANLKAFIEIVSSFAIPKELKDLGRSVGIAGPLLVSQAGQLKKTLLAHNWRMYPTQFELPANPQVFGRLIQDAGFDGIIYPSTKGPRNCVALFPANFAESDSYIEIADERPPGVTKFRLDADTWQEIAEPV
jgi:hypothetical protein